MSDAPKPPDILNRFVRIVLSYKPKPKSKPAKKRKRLAAKVALHTCGRCGEPNPDRLDMSGCRDSDCPEQGR